MGLQMQLLPLVEIGAMTGDRAIDHREAEEAEVVTADLVVAAAAEIAAIDRLAESGVIVEKRGGDN